MRFGLVIALAFLFVSCAHEVFVFDEGVPPVTEHRYDEGILYEGGNPDSTAVVIFLNGGSQASVLGAREGHPSVKGPSWFYGLLHYYGDKTRVIAPEKPNAFPGENHCYDRTFLESYTVPNIITHYATVLDRYLSENNIENAAIIGMSEGALVMPGVYTAMNEKDRVKKMVPIAGGGMKFNKVADLQNDHGPEGSVHIWWDLVEKTPNSIEEVYLGLTHKYWYSWKDYSPLEYFRQIDISVLFVHGLKDTRIPPESTQMVESELPDKPFEYLYIDRVGHNLGSQGQKDVLFTGIGVWLGILN